MAVGPVDAVATLNLRTQLTQLRSVAVVVVVAVDPVDPVEVNWVNRVNWVRRFSMAPCAVAMDILQTLNISI